VLLALGFTGVEDEPLFAGLGLQLGPRGLITTQPEAEGRLAPGLYAVGDAVSGPSLVVRAIASGLVAARTIQADYGLETI
jgi:glutamate synthase (NADPH/NADH) small chain